MIVDETPDWEDDPDVSVDDLDSYCGCWWLGWPAIALTALARGFRHGCVRIYFYKVSIETRIAKILKGSLK